MILPEGTLLQGGKYKIEEKIGQGSFGITYLAEHTSLGKKVAIKEFFMKELNSRCADGSITGLSDGSMSYNYAQKFRKEAHNLAEMEHPNIVRVTDSFEENGTFYYVMEYVEGGNLNDYIKDNPISFKDAVAIITDIAKGLMYMHEEKHMLHLDLKPGNVMRRASDGHIFLIDFGLSKHYDKNGTPETSTTIGGGTPGYAPTEQGDKAKDGEFRPTIDVYALGATLFKLLTNETPPTASEVINDDEILLNKMRSQSVPQNLIDIVINSMMPSYKKRTQSIRAFINSIPSLDDVTFSTTETNNGEPEETEYVKKPGSTNEETEYVESSGEKHNDFDESKYVILPEYKNVPVKTRNKAEGNDKEAMLALGMMCLRGDTLKQDFEAASSWFLKMKNLGDDRGEMLLAQWDELKNKYSLTDNKDTNSSNSKGGNKITSNGSNASLWIVGAIVFIFFAIFYGVKSYKENKLARIESIAQNTKDWYIDANNNVYCVVEGSYHYVDFYGIPDGYRVLHYSSTDSDGRKTYAGNFYDGRRNDTGATMTWVNGDSYTGSFNNGYMSNGTYKVKSDGSYFKGSFWYNKPYNGKWYNKRGRVLQTVRYGY